ncbi:methanogenesis multiheme c-type cytochrome [Methanolobus sp. ZRKC2]|uniref:methanogenesis multiheme c-type cytochrome n=1 Tax=Methanolobus sp. ZRKC2 TaxID=3125783 RepID=UPI00324D7CA9
MDKLNTVLIAILILMFAAAGVNAFAGYSGNNALAVHYMTEQKWSDGSCAGCHFGMDDQVAESYHVDQDLKKWTSFMDYGVDVDSIEGEERARTFGQTHPGGNYMAEYGVELDCMICHEQHDLYDYEARSEVISSGNFDMADEAALGEARSEVQKEPLYVISYMLDVLTPLPLVTEIHDEVNAGPRGEQCASTCHISEVPKTAVTWVDENHALYDAHAELDCIDCHETEDHQIGSPELIDAPESVEEAFEVEVKSCDAEGCHAGISHGALVDGHLSALECETCHIPALPGAEIEGGGALEMFSWANGMREDVTRDEEFTPAISWYRGIPYDSLPVETGMGEDAMLKPFNIVTGVWWDEGTNPEVAADPNGSASIGNPIGPAIVMEADIDGNGEVTVEEIRSYDGNSDGNADYPDAVLRNVEMYFPVSHNIAGSNVGLAEPLGCADCHGVTGTAIDWQALGYETDPAGADSDFTGTEIDVSIPGQRPTEVEREPAF